MASEIRVDKVKSLSGIGTVTLSQTGVDIAGVTTASTLRVTTGIVTTLTSTTGIVTTLTANTLTANDIAKVGSGITLSPDGDVFTTGVSTFSSNVNIGIGTTALVSITPNEAIKATFTGASGQDIIHITTRNLTADTFANVRGDNKGGIRIRGGGSYGGGMIELGGGLRSTDPGVIKFHTGTDSTNNNTEKVRINAAGKLLIGISTARNVGGSQLRSLQIEGTAAESAMAIVRNSANTSGAGINLGKSRSAGVGGNAIVQSGDKLGVIGFAGADGTDLQSVAAQIAGEVDGTPGANDMPGRLVFKTTSDGNASSTERLRIGSAGQIGIGGANYGTATSTYSSNTGKSSQVIMSGGSSAAPSWGYTNRPAFMAVATDSSQTVASGTWTKVELGTNTLDTDNAFSTSSHRFTVPTGGAGWYQVFGSTGIDDIQDADYVYARLYLNGSGVTYALGSDWGVMSNQVVQAQFSYMLHLDDGDYIELYVYHQEGSTEAVEGNRCIMGGFRLNI